jgi:phage-related protein
MSEKEIKEKILLLHLDFLKRQKAQTEAEIKIIETKLKELK